MGRNPFRKKRELSRQQKQERSERLRRRRDLHPVKGPTASGPKGLKAI
jgi:hypothetical protein